MRLQSIDATGVPPVIRFQVESLADTVVLAGRNGVGKTRLVQSLIQALRNPGAAGGVHYVVEATCAKERQAWGKDSLDSRVKSDMALLTKTLQANRRRVKWQSSILQFESDRSIQRIKPYAFSWDVGDPWEEDVGWESSFGFLRDRFQDTIHSLFRKAQSRRNKIAKTAEDLIKRGEKTMVLDFDDPLEPFKDAFSQLLAPKKLVDPDPKNQTLQYSVDGSTRPIDTLSSGEREVVNIVFDFLLRDPSDCIVFFDEPELHLHPELSYKLLRTLQNVAGRNQFIYCTHSPDIITATLDQSVVFIAPPQPNEMNQAIPVKADDETNEALRSLGQSIGIIALGKRIVLIEGYAASLDKQVYGAILGNKYPDMVLVPSEGRDVIASFAAVNAKVLRKSLWGVEFTMICDRDAVPPIVDVTRIESEAAGRLRVLRRYHLENYFLDADILASVFDDLEPDGSPLRDPNQVRAALREIARTRLSHTVALYVASELRQSAGNIDVMPSDCHGKSREELGVLLLAKVSSEGDRLKDVLEDSSVTDMLASVWHRLEASLDDGTWVSLFPGKHIFDIYAARTKLGSARLKQAYLREGLVSPREPFRDIIEIFEDFSRAV